MAQAVENPEQITVASGSTDVFPTVWTFESAAEVVVSVDAGDGYVVKTQGVHYDVAAGDWLNDGADCVFRAGQRPAAGHKVLRQRRTPRAQAVAFGDLARFQPETSEAAYDRQTRMIQEVSKEVERAVKIDPGGAPVSAQQILNAAAEAADGAQQVENAKNEVLAARDEVLDAVGGKANVALDNATMTATEADGETPLADILPMPVVKKNRESLSIDQWNGALVDDATALNRALTAAAEGEDNLPLKFLDSLDIDAPVFMPAGAQITGPYQSADHQFEAEGFSQAQGVLRVAQDVSIWGASASKLENCRIIRLGLVEPSNLSEAMAAITAMQGTAVRTANVIAFEMENVQFVGFNRAIDFENNGRGRLRNLRIDSVNGVRWQGSLDVSRLENVHPWPWLTVAFSPEDARVLWRAGIGIEIGAPTYFTGAIAGNTLTVSAVTPGTPRLYVGQVVFDGGALLGTITALGTGTGGTGTYTLSRTGSVVTGDVSSRAMRARVQNDWTNVESCFTFGYQRGIEIDEAKHTTIQNCASDNAAQLIGSAYDTEAQSKIGLNVQGESWNITVAHHRSAAQGRGYLIQPTALGGSPWSPRVTLTNPRGWGNGTYHVHHAAGEMVLRDPSAENVTPGGIGHKIRIDDAIIRADITTSGAGQPVIEYQSNTARTRTIVNGKWSAVSLPVADPLILPSDTETVILTGGGAFGTFSDPFVATDKRMRFIMASDVTIADGGSFRTRHSRNQSFKAEDVADFAFDGTRYVQAGASHNHTAETTTTPTPTAETGTFNTAPSSSLKCFDHGDGFVEIEGTVIIPSGATGSPGNPTNGLKVTMPFACDSLVQAEGIEINATNRFVKGVMAAGSTDLFLRANEGASIIGDNRNIQFRARYRKAGS